MTTQPAYLTLQSGTSRYLTQAAGTNYYLTLQDPAPYDNDVDLLLAEAVWYIDAHDSNYTGGQSVPNMGTAGTALNAQMGSGTAVDTNDPKWLAYSAADGAYAYLPGVAGNTLSVPDNAAYDVTDLDVRAYVAMDDWTPSALQGLVHKRGGLSSDISWSFFLSTTGALNLNVSSNGTANIDNTTASVSTAAVTATDGEALWVRATFDADNGSGGHTYRYYTSPDGSSWNALGSAVTIAGTTSIYASSASVVVGEFRPSNSPAAAKVYRAQILDSIDGTTVLDIDTSVLTSGDQTTFTEQSSNAATVTVNRSTSGRKTTLVGGWAGGGSLWLLGSDDYLEVIDDPAIDFGASDSFTVLAVHRAWATQGTNDVLVAKKADTTATTAGWSLTGGSSTALQGQSQIGDGTNGITAVSGSRTSGALATVAAVRSVAADALTVYLNGTAGTPVADTTTGSLANAEVMRVGRLSGAGTEYADMEFTAAAIWRRALTAGEIAGLNRYFQNRAYNG